MVAELRQHTQTMKAGFDRVDARFVELDRKYEDRFRRMDDRMSRQFMWIVGVQVTTLLAVVAVLAR